MQPTWKHQNILYKANITRTEGRNSNTKIVGNFNATCSAMDRLSRQNINRKILDLNFTLNQMCLMNIYRTFHPTLAGYIFFSSVHGTFLRIDHMLNHKTILNKFRNIEII